MSGPTLAPNLGGPPLPSSSTTPTSPPRPQRNTLKKPNPHAPTPTSPPLTPLQATDSPSLRASPLVPPSSADLTRASSLNLSRTGSLSGGAPHPSPSIRGGGGDGGGWDSSTGRASPALSTRSSGKTPRLGSQQGSSALIGKSLESYSAKHVVAALDSGEAGQGQGLGDDVWSGVCVRVLPLFNGEGLRAPVEDLNDLVHTHVERTLARVTAQITPSAHTFARHRNPQSAPLISTDAASLATALLAENLTDLINIGCITLSVKLWPPPPTPPLADSALLVRLAEVWHFFLTQVLPGLESVFWSLRSDQRLQAAVRGAGGSRTGRPPVQKEDEGRIDVRSLALIGFRDQLILPHLRRLAPLFGELAEEERDRSRSPARGRAGQNLDVGGSEAEQRSSSHQRGSTSINSIATLVPGNGSTPAPSGAATPAQPARTNTPLAGSSSLGGSARRRQLVATLASVLTGDDRQLLIEDLLRTMRTGNPGGMGSRPSGKEAFSTEGPPHEGGRAARRESLMTVASPTVPLDETQSAFDLGGGPTTRNGRARAGTMDSLEEEILPLPASLARTATQTSVPPPLPTFMAAPIASTDTLLPPSASMSLLNLSNTSSVASGEVVVVAPSGEKVKEKKHHHFLGRMMRSHSGGVDSKKDKDKFKDTHQ